MSSKRYSLPSSFEHCDIVDCLATYDDFEVLKGLKQLPFDQGDFSAALPRIVKSLEQFAPPPLSLPKNWLGEVTRDNTAVVSDRHPVPLRSHKTGEDVRSPQALPVGTSNRVLAETPAPATATTATPLPEIPPKSPERTEHSHAQTDTPKNSATSGPTTIHPRRQLSSTFVRGQRLPFSIVEEDEQETSESCYSTEEGAASSDSQHAETNPALQQKDHIQLTSSVSDYSRQPRSVSNAKRPSRAQLVKDRMRRMVNARALRTRVRGQLV